MVVHFAKFCGLEEVTAPDIVALQKTLQIYSYLKSGLLIACILMLPLIAFVWICLGSKNKKEPSDVVQEIINFRPSGSN